MSKRRRAEGSENTGRDRPAAATPSPPEARRNPLPVSEPRWMTHLWTLAALLAAWSFGFTTMQGSDLWWHLAGGRWIWRTHTLNFVESWSFTRNGLPWYNPEWLSEVVFYGWASLFGTTALVWWKWAVLVGAFVGLFRLLRKLSGSALAGYLAMLAALAVGAPFFDIRPQLYTVLGFVVVLAIMLPLAHRLWLLPAVFLLWANLHSGYILGLVTLTLALIVAFMYGELPRKAGALLLVCWLICLINPSGLDALIRPFQFALENKSLFARVAEWKSPFEPGGIRSSLYIPELVAFALSLAAVFTTGIFHKNRRQIIASVFVGLATLLMSLRSRRFIPLFAIASALLLAPTLAHGLSWLGQRLGRLPRLQRSRAFGVAFGVGSPVLAVLFGIWRLAPYPLSGRAFLFLTAQHMFPVEAMSFVEANHIEGKVFNFYEWGGYIGLRSEGCLRVYVDGRGGLMYDEQTYRRYVRVLSLSRGWEDIVWDSGADFVLWPKRKHKQIEELRKSGRWRTLYSDWVAALLVRADRPAPGPLAHTPDSPWRDLALGWKATSAGSLALAEDHFKRALDGMPTLKPACEGLANVQALSNRMAVAEATLDRCQHMFPDSRRRKDLLALFRSRAQPTGREDEIPP